MKVEFDLDAALARLLHFLAIPGITGEEAEIGQAVVTALAEAGVPRSALHFDKAHTQIPLPTQTGNLIVKLPGSVSGPRRLFSTHLDTVPLCAGAVPLRRGKRIVPAGKTALGGDNRTGVACLVTMLTEIIKQRLPHPPLTVLFTVREESGLWGVRFVDPAELGQPEMGFNVDGGSARQITHGATGAQRWQAEVFGKAAHAGVHPERGVSALAVTALALARVYENGWFGKVQRNGSEGTSNVGSVGDQADQRAGQATNVVTDYTLVRGEARSHEPTFVRAITAAYKSAFQQAAAQVRDERGRPAKVKFAARTDYHSFHLKVTSPVVRQACAAVRALGWQPALRISNGGLDANWLVRHGIPTITFGAGQNNPHTVDEFVNLDDFAEGCRLALTLATA
jgi:tripeptide aminopeptidase